MKRIAIFQSDMRVGGIQRSLANLLNSLAGSDKFEIDVFITDEKNIFYTLPRCENIRIYYLNKIPYINRLLPFSLVRLLWGKRIIKQIEAYVSKCEYDVSIDFNSYWNECALGTILTKAKRRVCFVHNDVQVKMKEEYKYRLLHFFFRNKYSLYDQMAMVSEGIVKPFYDVNTNAPEDYIVINNIIDTQEIQRKLISDSLEEQAELAIEQIKEHPNRVDIVSLGRLCHQKGYDILIDYVKKVSEKKSSEKIHFTIIGDGPLHEELYRSVEEKGIEEFFTFTGNLKNPFPVMAQCDAFLMCSRYEGQPLAFWEAMALKLPVIIPKHLEKYTGGIDATEDINKALCNVTKRCISKAERYQVDSLNSYNQRILNNFEKLCL